MTERLIEDERGRRLLAQLIERQKLPFVAVVKDGRHRSLNQNALLWKWIGEIAAHRGDVTAQEVASELKLIYGVPLLCAEDEEFAAMWLKPEVMLSHEDKLKMMQFISVTSIMSMKQLATYLDEIYRATTAIGIELSDPERLRDP